MKEKTVINFVTAVSREYNLPRLLFSIEESLKDASSLHVRWILVFDAPGPVRPWVDEMIRNAQKIEIVKLVFGGERKKYALAQKNMGLDVVTDGFFLCLDDDNVLHPQYLKRIEKAIADNPSKKAFVVSQKRWDHFQLLRASAYTVAPGKIDSAMFLVHKDLFGTLRYDHACAGSEDGYFIQALHKKAPETFVFIDEVLSYFNYLRVERTC